MKISKKISIIVITMFIFNSCDFSINYGKNRTKENKWESRLWGNNPKGAYDSNTKRIYSNLYVGVKNGTSVTRIGCDSPYIQDAFQNGWHKWAPNGLNAPYFQTDYDTPAKGYFYSGWNNPYSIYNY